MSASLERLKAAATAAAGEITTLKSANADLASQLAAAQAASGTPDSELDAVSAQLEAVLPPPTQAVGPVAP